LLRAESEVARARAWEGFVATYSRVVLHAVRSATRDADAAMDAYAFVLEKLSEENFRRLHTFSIDGPGKYTTWLVVVVRRLANDWHRHRYGRRPRSDEDQSMRDERAARRRLVDLTAEAIELSEIPDLASTQPDSQIVSDEIRLALLAEIDGLDAGDRLLIKLRFEDDLSAKDIASLMRAATPFHVYRRLNRILAVLKRRLVARGVESPSG
jgi:RNA polymerase sigma factor (sigma-70 family)